MTVLDYYISKTIISDFLANLSRLIYHSIISYWPVIRQQSEHLLSELRRGMDISILFANRQSLFLSSSTPIGDGLGGRPESIVPC